jgi:hypothetical protein
MMASWVSGAALFCLAFLQAAPSPQRATVSPQAFVGTWVGTQRWSIENPPPGANQDQPVSITIELVDGKLTGTMTPFMGGDDGATFLEARIVGDELQASAGFRRVRPATGAAGGGSVAPETVGEDDGPKPAPAGRGRGRGPTWKDATKIQCTFANDGLDLKGTADVTMNDVKWLTFSYDLSKKRSRY